ncbi:MAG: tRNA (adenosine(37)-N6)-dimethylallyltransferase MiaA [Altibacter sp.]|uniref:tRNA (adenosine(37)-N6)-dimethylallyltransferase MiaA n=1 Tax=Altibacter sp. TaxID=2024823 RepID=UPI001DF84920|nr:tRNA (adenosine(37)-N6)-dimethylallyltransferase MiaA [Altibacter sp.]MBZ0326468.1 tRNA (adenosine(37)-N6)-dimethylallyltransferase MiaA [Altibacter sp.]
MKKPLLICVVGPTAIGKTSLAIAIAKAFTTEIISADSRQFFAEMTIGTAVPTAEELAAVPHHFIQNKSIFEPYSVGEFEREAIQKLEELFQQHEVVVIAGGSGLYVDAVVNGLDSFPDIASEIRTQLNAEYEIHGIEPLQKELEQVDPSYFDKVDIHNAHRLIRALEVYRSSGKPYSSFLKKNNTQRNFEVLYIGLTAERATIYKRINKRVDEMIANGLVQEAEDLYPNKALNALQTVGYQELFQFFEGRLKLEQAIEEIKKNTRRFAKRQLTWLRKNEMIHWFDYQETENEIISFIKEKKSYK